MQYYIFDVNLIMKITTYVINFHLVGQVHQIRTNVKIVNKYKFISKGNMEVLR